MMNLMNFVILIQLLLCLVNNYRAGPLYECCREKCIEDCSLFNSNEAVNIADCGNCGNYYTCYKGRKIPKECNMNYLFDVNKRKCLLTQFVNCGARKIPVD